MHDNLPSFHTLHFMHPKPPPESVIPLSTFHMFLSSPSYMQVASPFLLFYLSHVHIAPAREHAPSMSSRMPHPTHPLDRLKEIDESDFNSITVPIMSDKLQPCRSIHHPHKWQQQWQNDRHCCHTDHSLALSSTSHQTIKEIHNVLNQLKGWQTTHPGFLTVHPIHLIQ